MSKGESSTNLGAIVSFELKERLKKYAASKRWSMSQAAGILIEEGLDRAESSSKQGRRSSDRPSKSKVPLGGDK